MAKRKQNTSVQLTDSEESRISDRQKNIRVDDAAGALISLSIPPEMKANMESPPKLLGPATRNRMKMAKTPPESKRADSPRERPKGKTCSVCGEQVKNIYELRDHMLLHNLHTCTKCLRYFKYKRSFENHRYFCQGVTESASVNGSFSNFADKGDCDPVSDTSVGTICDNTNTKSNPKEIRESSKKDGEQVSKEDGAPTNATPDANLARDNTTTVEQTTVANAKLESPSDKNLVPDVPPVPVPVKRRRGRPPGSTNRFPRPTLIPVPGVPKPSPISRKRSYRTLESMSNEAIEAQMGITAQANLVMPEFNGTYLDLSTDVTSTTNTHSSCVVHSGNPNRSSSGNTCCHIPYSSQIFLPSPVIPSFGNPKEASFIWQGIQIQGEKPLVTRMEGTNPVTDQQYVLYKCCLCGNAFPGIPLLASHLLAHTRGSKEHTCQKCGAIFKWRSQLEVHEQVHQVMDNRVGSPKTSSCMMMCNSMGLMGSSENLAGPSVGCHRPSPIHPPCGVAPGDIYPPTVSPIPSQESLGASSGGSLLKSSSPSENLQERSPKRIAREGGSVSGKSAYFQCKFCPKSFDRLFSLQRHERIHTGIKPCFCKLCGKGFSERRNLRHHIIRFHSDTSQRELFRRNRKPRPHNNNSSLKLVSFLKRTAVRILNSMDQSRFDSELIEEQAKQMSFDVTTSEKNIKLAQQQEAGITKPAGELVTVVIPTDAPTETNQTSRLSSSQGSDEEQRELLQDPKRSLIGNRRKGRPFRFACVQNSNQADEGDIVCNGDFSMDGCVKEEPGTSLDLEGENGGLCSDLLQVQLTEDMVVNGFDENNLSPESMPTFKAKLRGHGAFFSSYNPSTTAPKELKVYKTNTSRLGVVAKPVIRTEACKPQIGPDGKFVYPCTYCFKTFCSTSDLNRHMDFHEDVRPFKCPYCSYYSRTNSQLKVHMMRHQGIKHYLCHVCNYNGVTQSDLNRHFKTRTHLLRTKNVCTGCGLGFYTRSLLDEHERMYHHSDKLRAGSHPEVLATVKDESNLNEGSSDQTHSSNCDELERNNNDYYFGSKNSKNIPVNDVQGL